MSSSVQVCIQPSSELGTGKLAHVPARRVRNPPLVEPTVATFSLGKRLPKVLADLHVPIDTGMSSVTLQYSVHACPRRVRREIGLVFPDVVGRESGLLFIPTFQKTVSAMIAGGSDSQAEKDEKLHLFYRWGGELVGRLQAEGYWADITDPMSGMALFSSCGPSPYPDVEGAEILLHYRPFNIGCCFVLSHPQWGTHIYPATAFTLAPAAVVNRVLAEMTSSEH
ncbi:hypothetical protein FBU59_004059 [Linderina macrospora]|uniref:Uncharacterized protein n=1 Tax=Linderina macrospora TaxID=4868 RepID=A0ACC1J6S0_9FUNG|nr:hypothetical protein FBU59_004059 [Linderina macrospora]